ncbi:homeobox-3 [Actinidia rufa]|uniref:Homeobox-3 n=1 Tax=Actinidia rufa TaxID=165716 RepID=A0A7J0EZQ0_9ERIC|nr:homeobox-3 [Actinidia rufa]
MASSNRHWPSMFKSKPCNHHQWQHDINPNSPLMSTACHRTPYSSVKKEPRSQNPGGIRSQSKSGSWKPSSTRAWSTRPATRSERSEPSSKNTARWATPTSSTGSRTESPAPNTSNSATSNPPNNTNTNNPQPPRLPPPPATSSSSSSEKPSLSPKASPVVDVANSQAASVNQTYLFGGLDAEFAPEGFYFPAGFGFPENDQAAVGGGPGVLLSELMMMSGQRGHMQKKVEEEKLLKLKQQQQQQQMTSYGVIQSFAPPPTVPSAITQILGADCLVESQKSTVFINDVAFEVGVGPFNVREAFGDDAMLVHCTGQPVVTNEWGVTLQSLQHGGFYYLQRTLTPITAAPQLIWYLDDPPFS